MSTDQCPPALRVVYSLGVPYGGSRINCNHSTRGDSFMPLLFNDLDGTRLGPACGHTRKGLEEDGCPECGWARADDIGPAPGLATTKH
jgi:hypothetical protein